MFPINLYHRILHLCYSNLRLLKIYYVLYDNLDGKKEQKDLLTKKIELRKRIELELREANDALRQNGKPLARATFTTCLPPIIKVQYNITEAFMPVSPDRCHACELQNLDYYYRALYLPEADHQLVNLFLEHKEKIEDFLIGNL